jgi:rhomboid protease GluP
MTLSEPVTLYRHPQRRRCEELALVLAARGLSSRVVHEAPGFALEVAAHEVIEADEELRRYRQENGVAPRPAAPVPLTLRAGSWIGVLAWLAVLLLVADLALAKALGRDWMAVGALRGGGFSPDTLRQSVTALTLHRDAAHLAGNAAFGGLLGYFAGQMLGPGLAWASILACAVLANLLTALLMPAGMASIGASTAVFAAVGLLAGLQGWRWRARLPWLAGLGLLLLTGSEGVDTNLPAHLSGFLAGLGAGAGAGKWLLQAAGHPRSQIWGGGLCLATLILAWLLALH